MLLVSMGLAVFKTLVDLTRVGIIGVGRWLVELLIEDFTFFLLFRYFWEADLIIFTLHSFFASSLIVSEAVGGSISLTRSFNLTVLYVWLPSPSDLLRLLGLSHLGSWCSYFFIMNNL